jgi:hypothetical protein
MTDHKNEYQKFADSAVRGREKEEAFGRLRLCVFWAVVGPLGVFLLKMLNMLPPHKIIALAVVGSAPLAVILLVINFVRLPNEYKASPQAILIGLMTLVGAGATLALARMFDLFKAISP